MMDLETPKQNLTASAHRLLVQGARSPELPLRVLNLLSQLDLAYDRVAIEREGDRYVIAVEHDRLDLQRACIAVEKMRVMVLVERADLYPVNSNAPRATAGS